MTSCQGLLAANAERAQIGTQARNASACKGTHRSRYRQRLHAYSLTVTGKVRQAAGGTGHGNRLHSDAPQPPGAGVGVAAREGHLERSDLTYAGGHTHAGGPEAGINPFNKAKPTPVPPLAVLWASFRNTSEPLPTARAS